MKIKLSKLAEACFKFDQDAGRFSPGTKYENLSDSTKHEYEGEALRIVEIIKSFKIKSTQKLIDAVDRFYKDYNDMKDCGRPECAHCNLIKVYEEYLKEE
jgi:hypothetical protein